MSPKDREGAEKSACRRLTHLTLETRGAEFTLPGTRGTDREGVSWQFLTVALPTKSGHHTCSVAMAASTGGPEL